MSSPALLPWSQTGAIPSRLARIARPRFAACGLDGMSPARQGLAMQVRQIARARHSERSIEEWCSVGPPILVGASAADSEDDRVTHCNSKFRSPPMPRQSYIIFW